MQIVKALLLVCLGFSRLHYESLLLCRADVGAVGATCTVCRVYLHHKLVVLQISLSVGNLQNAGYTLRSLLKFLIGEQERTDCSMRADGSALVALDTVGWVPLRNMSCNSSLLISSGSGRNSSVREALECAYRKIVAALSVYWIGNLPYPLRSQTVVAVRNKLAR